MPYFLRVNILLGSLLIGALAVLCPLPAQAAWRGDDDASQVAEVRAEIHRQLDATDAAIANLDQEIATQQKAMASLTDDIKALKTKELELRQKLAVAVQQLHLALANMVRIERQPLQALLTYDALQVKPQRQSILNISRKALQQQIDAGRTSLRDLISTMTEAEERQAALDQAIQALGEQRQKLDTLRTEQAHLLTLPAADRAALLDAAKRLGKAGDLPGLLELKTKLSGILPKPRRHDYGKLPVDGEVVLGYGETDPTTDLTSQGLRIAASPGAQVIALKDGRVIYSGPFKGYGYLVILEHDHDTHSLYSGFASSPLTPGDFVTAGSVLGTLSAEDPKPMLYLEVRHGGDPVDPATWLPQ